VETKDTPRTVRSLRKRTSVIILGKRELLRFDPSNVPLRLIEAAKRRNLVPLIGAGISQQAITSAEGVFPSWHDLLEDLKKKAHSEGRLDSEEAKEIDQLLNRGRFLMVAEELHHKLSSESYRSTLEEKFDPPDAKPTEIYRALFRLKPPLILTTNYDCLLEKAYIKFQKEDVDVFTYRDAPEVQRRLTSDKFARHPFIFKIHGTIKKPSEIILTESDYRELIYHQPGYRLLLSAVFLTHVVLMLGFSLKDRELILLLEAMRESLKRRSHPDYIFLPEDAAGSVERFRLKEDFGVHVIPYKPSRGHPEVLEFVNHLVSQVEGSELAAPPNME
jgi:hypothetical protein